MQLQAGSLIVFEGLDKAGKSTQLDLLRAVPWQPPEPRFLHMPSGDSSLTHALYQITETEPIETSMGRQLLHLACHSENIGRIQSYLASGAVVLDRWWWSTLAYGVGGGDIDPRQQHALEEVIEAVWGGFGANLVLVFGQPYQDDAANSPGVEQMYQRLADRYPNISLPVRQGDPDTIHRSIVATLVDRGLAAA